MTSKSSSFQQQVAPLVTELFASANAHDTDRHLAVYARDPALIFIINGEVIRGWDAYREKQRQWWDDGRAVGVYEAMGEPVYEALGEDSGLTTLFMAGRRQLPNGQLRERQMAFTALWRRRPEGWRITYAHESSTR
jgi:ketosteroid isomerase-like protein